MACSASSGHAATRARLRSPQRVRRACSRQALLPSPALALYGCRRCPGGMGPPVLTRGPCLLPFRRRVCAWQRCAGLGGQQQRQAGPGGRAPVLDPVLHPGVRPGQQGAPGGQQRRRHQRMPAPGCQLRPGRSATVAQTRGACLLTIAWLPLETATMCSSLAHPHACVRCAPAGECAARGGGTGDCRDAGCF